MGPHDLETHRDAGGYASYKAFAAKGDVSEGGDGCGKMGVFVKKNGVVSSCMLSRFWRFWGGGIFLVLAETGTGESQRDDMSSTCVYLVF